MAGVVYEIHCNKADKDDNVSDTGGGLYMKLISIMFLILLIGIIIWLVTYMYRRLGWWRSLIVGGSLTFLVLFEFHALGRLPYVYGDEGYAFYDSFSIGRYGIDSHLMHNAVYSLSSGGQSVLYKYIAAPLLKVFGANLAAYRFPMALLMVIAIVFLIYTLYVSQVHPNVITGCALMLCTAEWLLICGHWADDCNIVVPFFILMVTFAFRGLVGKKYNIYVAFVLLSLLAYCYVGVWISLPLIYIALFVMYWRKQKISWRDGLINIVISAVLLFPIGCYVLVQFFHVPPFKLAWFSVARLPVTRQGYSIISFKGNVLLNIVNNVVGGFRQVLLGYDGFTPTSIPGFGLIYTVTFILAVMGIVMAVKRWRNSEFIQLMLLMTICVLPIVAFVTDRTCFTHWSVVLFVITVWAGVGLGWILGLRGNLSWLFNLIKVVLVLAIIVTTGKFTKYYFTEYVQWQPVSGWYVSFSQAQQFMEKLDSLSVRTYYGIPFDNRMIVECIKEADPHTINRIQNKYQCGNPPQTIQPGSAAYIVPKQNINKYRKLRVLPHKEWTLMGQKYVVYYKVSD